MQFCRARNADFRCGGARARLSRRSGTPMAQTSPRLLMISPIPADLRAVLEQKYGMTDYATLGGGPGKPVPAPGFDIAVTMSVYGIDAAQLAALPNVKLVACNGAGLERIDLAAARARGVAVCHTPDELAEDVADAAIALTYAIMRRVVEADRFVRSGRWTKERMAPSRRLAGKTVGIVGLGKIGRVVARRAGAIGMHILYFGPKAKAAVPYPFVATMLELAERSDVLLLSCPGGEATRHLVGA